MAMKVALFNIADCLFPYAFFLSLSCGYLKSYFEKFSVHKDTVEVSIEYENIFEELLRKKPEVIGISVASEFYGEAMGLAKAIKKALPEAVLIIGGYHISSLPQSFSKVFDFGVLGEGEQTFLELINAIFEKAGFDVLKNIRGLIFFDENGTLVKTEPRDFIPDLDSIPAPYRGKNRGIYTNIITSRGCPCGCSFCSTTIFWKHSIRFNSAEFVMEEMISLIKNKRIRHITFYDDFFMGDIGRLRKILGLIKQEKKTFRAITFGVSARPNIIVKNPEILDICREMHVLRVSLGFESGSDRMLEKIKGKNATVENNYKALSLLKRYPFFVCGGFIIGSPEEREEDVRQTYAFIRKSGLNGGYAALAIPYPGTQFWSYAEKQGLVDINMDFSKLRTICSFTQLKGDEFLLLSKDIDRKNLIDYGIKIQKHFSYAAVKSYFDLRKFNIRILALFLKDPAAFLPDFQRVLFSFLKNLYTSRLG